MIVRFKRAKSAAHTYLIGRLDQQLFPEDDHLDAIEFHRGAWWIGWCEDIPIAYCGVREWYSNRVFMARAGVVQAQRGQGLQRRMLKLREGHAVKQWGASRALTYTHPRNVASNNNLIRSGYLQWEPEAYTDQWINWWKDLV